MMVASKSKAKIMPKAIYFIMTMSEKPNAPQTNHNQRSRSNNAAGVGGAVGNGLVGTATPISGFNHPRNKENLVIGAQAVDNRHDEH